MCMDFCEWLRLMRDDTVAEVQQNAKKGALEAWLVRCSYWKPKAALVESQISSTGSYTSWLLRCARSRFRVNVFTFERIIRFKKWACLFSVINRVYEIWKIATDQRLQLWDYKVLLRSSKDQVVSCITPALPRVTKDQLVPCMTPFSVS